MLIAQLQASQGQNQLPLHLQRLSPKQVQDQMALTRMHVAGVSGLCTTQNTRTSTDKSPHAVVHTAFKFSTSSLTMLHGFWPGLYCQYTTLLVYQFEL